MSPRRSEKLEIGVLYGMRALMVLFVMNYHIWQQSWLGQYVRVGGRLHSFDFWTRSSYVFVDGMILLSGFLLYLPYARQKAEGTPVPSVRRFYLNRLIRILPSYLLAVGIMLFCVALPQGLYATARAAVADVAAHLTFTFLFWPQTYLQTPLNAALWTIAVEMQFYALLPLLARAMQKRPLLTAGGMMALGWAYRLAMDAFATNLGMVLNQMPAFLDVYALGMLGAAAYIRLRGWLAGASVWERRTLHTACVAAFVLGVWALTGLLRVQSAAGSAGHTALQRSQMRVRLPLALVFLCLMLSASFWPRVLQKLLDNRLMRFLSTISMNLYIWHQVLSVQMRLAWFPNTDALHTTPTLQRAYTVLCFSVALLAAMAATYGVERPVSRWAARRLDGASTPPEIRFPVPDSGKTRIRRTEPRG